jgi:hypothetical protein
MHVLLLPLFLSVSLSGRNLIRFLQVGVNHITGIKKTKYLFSWLCCFGHSSVLVLQGQVFFVLEKHASWNNMC